VQEQDRRACTTDLGMDSNSGDVDLAVFERLQHKH